MKDEGKNGIVKREEMFAEASRKALELASVMEDLKVEMAVYLRNNRTLEKLVKCVDELVQYHRGAVEKQEKVAMELESRSSHFFRRLEEITEKFLEIPASVEASNEALECFVTAKLDRIEEELKELRSQIESMQRKLDNRSIFSRLFSKK